jgi:hypothetical protein
VLRGSGVDWRLSPDPPLLYTVTTSSFERLGVVDLAGLSGLGLFFALLRT